MRYILVFLMVVVIMSPAAAQSNQDCTGVESFTVTSSDSGWNDFGAQIDWYTKDFLPMEISGITAVSDIPLLVGFDGSIPDPNWSLPFSETRTVVDTITFFEDTNDPFVLTSFTVICPTVETAPVTIDLDLVDPMLDGVNYWIGIFGAVIFSIAMLVPAVNLLRYIMHIFSNSIGGK